MTIGAEQAASLIQNHEWAVTNLTKAQDRDRGFKGAAKDLARANRVLFVSLVGRDPTAEELAACEVR